MFNSIVPNHITHYIFNVDIIEKKVCSVNFYIVLMYNFQKFFPLEIEVLNKEF